MKSKLLESQHGERLDAGTADPAVTICAELATVNLVRILVIRHAVGVFPFGSDIFVIMAAGLGLGWGGKVIVAQFGVSPLWNTIVGIGFFLVAFGVVTWTWLLNELEKNSIFGAIRSSGRILFRRTR